MNERGNDNQPALWVRDENGACRRAVIHSMLRRLPGWDYRGRAIYQITITLADRASRALGRLEVKGPSGWIAIEEAGRAGRAPYPGNAPAGRAMGAPEAIEARVVPSAVGAAVAACWGEIPDQWPGVSSLGFQLMPDHIHGILFVERPQEKTLGNIIGSFKSKSASRVKGILAARGQEPDGRGGAIGGAIGGGAFGSTPRAAGLWSPGYQDTILFHAGQLAAMKRYLADNPRRLAVKRLYPDHFRVVDELAVPLADRGADAPRSMGRFSAIGNRFLLARPLAQVQVSRRDFGYLRTPKPGGGRKIARDEAGEPRVEFSTPAYAEKKDALFAAAKHGAVLISPCVSDGERQIAHAAFAAGLPLITLHNKGFAKLQKPGGRHFDACAEGRLLMLAPAAWPYQPGEKPMTRFDATAMNRLCQWIVGDPPSQGYGVAGDAAEINYHGMKPENVDALARAAAKVETA